MNLSVFLPRVVFKGGTLWTTLIVWNANTDDVCREGSLTEIIGRIVAGELRGTSSGSNNFLMKPNQTKPANQLVKKSQTAREYGSVFSCLDTVDCAQTARLFAENLREMLQQRAEANKIFSTSGVQLRCGRLSAWISHVFPRFLPRSETSVHSAN